MPRHRRIKDRVFELVKTAVPYDYISVSGLDLESYRVGSFSSVVSDFPPAFAEAYSSERLFEVDPLVLARDFSDPVVMEADAERAVATPSRLRYLLDRFDISNRLAIFLRRSDAVYGAVVLSRQASNFDAEEIDFLSTMAPALHERVMGPVRDKFAARAIGLSDGELECLRLIAQGFTSEEAAAASRFSKDTVDTYLKSATRKLGASNRLHAIAEALRRKLID